MDRASSTQAAPRYEVADINGENIDDLASFLSGHPNYPRERLRADPKHLIEKLGAPPRGCLARLGSRVVSSCTLTRKPLIWNGAPCMGGEIADVFTAAEHQRRGLFTTLANRTTASGFDHGYVAIYGTPNAVARPVWLENCKYAEWPQAIVSLGCPVRVHRIALSLWRTMSSRTVEVSNFEFWSKHEEAWRRHARHYGLAIDRTVAYLTWRYRRLSGPFQIFRVDDESRAAYLVTRTFRQGGETRSAIADLWSPRLDDRYALLARAMLDAIAAGAKWLTMWAPLRSVIAVQAMSLGFIPHRVLSLVVKAERAPVRSSVYFMMGDSDNV